MACKYGGKVKFKFFGGGNLIIILLIGAKV